MDKGVAVALAAVVGGLVATQAPLNSQLGRVVGGLNASVVALAVSFVALLTLAALTDGLGGIRNIGDAPLHVAIGGGLAGALYVGSIVFTVRALGAGGLTAVTIAGQLGGRDRDRPLRLARRRALADHRRQGRRRRAAGGRDVARHP